MAKGKKLTRAELEEFCEELTAFCVVHEFVPPYGEYHRLTELWDKFDASRE